MCSMCEKAGQPGYRDLGNRDENLIIVLILLDPLACFKQKIALIHKVSMAFHYLDMKVIAKEVQTAVKRGKVSTRYSVSEQKHYNE